MAIVIIFSNLFLIAKTITSKNTSRHVTMKYTAIILGACALAANAAVLDTYTSTDCSGAVQDTVNVWDNSCANWFKPFSSYIIRTAGGSGQQVTGYSGGGCAGDTTHCSWADEVGDCMQAIDASSNPTNALWSGSAGLC